MLSDEPGGSLKGSSDIVAEDDLQTRSAGNRGPEPVVNATYFGRGVGSSTVAKRRCETRREKSQKSRVEIYPGGDP